jgi:hypothetical protein
VSLPTPMSGIAHGHRADLSGRGEIGLEQRRRTVLRVGDVVEAERRFIRRQQSRHIHIEGQQIANRVGVLGPVETPQNRASRCDVIQRCAIELALQPVDETIGGGTIRPRRAKWRHRADTQLPDDLLPASGIARELREVHRIERQTTGLQPGVMTGDTVFVDRRAMRGGILLRRGSQRRVAPRDGDHQRGTCGRDRRDRSPPHGSCLNPSVNSSTVPYGSVIVADAMFRLLSW